MFVYCRSLTSVNLPKVTTIGVDAFYDCDLRTLDLPEVVGIAGSAFAGNVNLTTVDLPKAESFGDSVLAGCTSLTTLKLGYDGELDWQEDWGIFENVDTSGIDLYLGTHEYYNNVDVDNKTWRGYTFKSISTY